MLNLVDRVLEIINCLVILFIKYESTQNLFSKLVFMVVVVSHQLDICCIKSPPKDTKSIGQTKDSLSYALLNQRSNS